LNMKRSRRLRRFLKLAIRSPFEKWSWPADHLLCSAS